VVVDDKVNLISKWFERRRTDGQTVRNDAELRQIVQQWRRNPGGNPNQLILKLAQTWPGEVGDARMRLFRRDGADIDRACRQVREWMDQGLAVPRVAVNVAARQFAAGDLDAVVARALERHGVPVRGLELERTESMLVERPEATAELLHRLKAVGITLSLDDFGTGYSSLGYLQRFPIDTLKIDQSFVRAIDSEDAGSPIVDVVIALAHRLNLRVVAEGVETRVQRDYLVQHGCDELQGYHFGKPVGAAGDEGAVGGGGDGVAVLVRALVLMRRRRAPPNVPCELVSECVRTRCCPSTL